jgi:hypothetical protein
MAVIDYSRGDDWDLVFEGGDFARTNDSTSQHIELILASSKGNIRNAPLLGANTVYLLQDDGGAQNLFLYDLQQSIRLDGAEIVVFKIIDGNPLIQANYPS